MKKIIILLAILSLGVISSCIDQDAFKPSIGNMKAEINGSYWEAKKVLFNDGVCSTCGNYLLFDGNDGKTRVFLDIIDKLQDNESREGVFMEQSRDLLNQSINRGASKITIRRGSDLYDALNPELYISYMDKNILEGTFSGNCKHRETGEVLKVINGYFRITVK